LKTTRIEDLALNVSSGITPLRSNPDFWNEGSIPWLKTEQLGQKDIYETNEHISEIAVSETSIKLNPKNTLSIAMYGEGKTRGNVSILREPMTTNQACCNIVLDEQFADVEYIYYGLKNNYYNLRNLSSGVRKNLNSGDIKGFSVALPESLADQKKITKVLSTLDAKIELNNRINAELEAMAKLLYDYWFVQFDFPCLPSDYKPLGAGKIDCHDGDSPVGASKLADIEAACNYRAVGGLPIPEKGKFFIYVLLCSDDSFYIGMTDDLYRRWHEHKTGQGAKWTKANSPVKVIHHEVFDSRSAASEREKELKTGFGRKWLKSEYEKLSKPEGSPAHQSKHPKAGSPAHQSKLMQAGPMTYNTTLKREIPEGWEINKLKSIAPVLTGKEDANHSTPHGKFPFFTCGDAPLRCDDYKFEGKAVLLAGNGNFGLKFYEGKFNAYQRTYVLIPNSEKHYGVMWFAVKDSITALTQGSSGSIIKFLRKGDIEDINIPLPKESDCVDFDSLNRILLAVLNNQKQNQELTALRDWLLPMLMNGQVTVEG
tara:strand:+ start:1482 stop:3104 length:1623 start_codon:yes stop_codon:yes gene_type:complete